jgi:hypothetical protein
MNLPNRLGPFAWRNPDGSAGHWTPTGRPTGQVVILNLDADGNPIHPNRRAFEAAVSRLAASLRRAFQQQLVVLDVQANGRTVGTGLAT